MRQLVGKNQENNKYFFIVDSLDGLLRKDDLAKTFEESQKVAGGAVVCRYIHEKNAQQLFKKEDTLQYSFLKLEIILN